jgi:hypothetical protein
MSRIISSRTIGGPDGPLATLTQFRTHGALWATDWVSYTGRLPRKHDEQYGKDLRDGIRYTVLSYATPIGWVTDAGEIRIPDVHYSVTTSRHQTQVRAWMGRQHWHAGWHMPCYLPEIPYERFTDESDARAYIASELDRLDESEGWLDAHTAWHNGASLVSVEGYWYELYRCSDDCQSAVCGRCGHVVPASGLTWDGEDFSAECACGGLIR